MLKREICTRCGGLIDKARQAVDSPLCYTCAEAIPGNILGSLKTDELAGKLYTTYCAAVGGKAFNGDPLPPWSEFRADEKKTKQSEAWIETARAAVAALLEAK